MSATVLPGGVDSGLDGAGYYMLHGGQYRAYGCGEKTK